MPDKKGQHEGWIDAAIRAGLRAGLKETMPIDDRNDSDLLREPAKKMERGRAIAEEALLTINGERQDAYGNPEDTFKQIAVLWEAYLGTKVTPPMVADMMCLLKIAREQGGKGKRDNAVDLLGYAMLGASMRGYDA